MWQKSEGRSSAAETGFLGQSLHSPASHKAPFPDAPGESSIPVFSASAHTADSLSPLPWPEGGCKGEGHPAVSAQLRSLPVQMASHSLVCMYVGLGTQYLALGTWLNRLLAQSACRIMGKGTQTCWHLLFGPQVSRVVDGASEDHSTVLHVCWTVESQVATDSSWRAHIIRGKCKLQSEDPISQ